MADPAATAETGAPRWAWLGRLQYWLAVIFIVGWTGVVCGGLGVQFASWEYPCPLCMVQRMFMLLAATGGAYIVHRGMTGAIHARDYMTGWGLTIIACVAGGFASWRQTMLHILPGDSGYGGAVLGLHMYVWAWILFVAAIATAGVLLCFSDETAAHTIPARPHRLIGTIAIAFLALVLAVNVVSMFCETGFHWFLPDNPTRYQLFYDLHIIS